MPFPIKTEMDDARFGTEIIDYYWPHLTKDLANHEFIGKFITDTNKRTKLRDDYAQIGSFLTNKSRVEAALVPLEEEIRTNLAALKGKVILPRSRQELTELTVGRGMKSDDGKSAGSAAHLKSEKLLSNALRRLETEGSFNHEQILKGTFFDDAKHQAKGTLHKWGAVSDRAGRLTPKTSMQQGRDGKQTTKNEPVPLPSGVPSVVGDLDPLAFNSTLLRHGYQFKDVAAGPYHGEYTHRLQWHAIMRAKLPLTNSCIDIYRSLGYQVAAATANLQDGKHAWLWEALFDTAETSERSDFLKTMAYTTNGQIYTCPENLNKALMKVPDYDDRAESLWCLRVLLATRWKKRFDEALPPLAGAKPVGMEKLVDRMAQDRTTTVVSSSQRTIKELAVTMQPIEKGPLAGKIDKKTGLPYAKKVENWVERTVDTPQLNLAGYALAWYLRNDGVQ